MYGHLGKKHVNAHDLYVNRAKFDTCSRQWTPYHSSIVIKCNLSTEFVRDYQLLPIEWLKDIWRPDSYFKNAKRVTFQVGEKRVTVLYRSGGRVLPSRYGGGESNFPGMREGKSLSRRGGK